MTQVKKNLDPDFNQIPVADLFAKVSANIEAETKNREGNKPSLEGVNQKIVKKKPPTPSINNFCKNITEQAKKGLIDPVIGRQKEIQRVVQILGRRRKNNPVILGEAGTGKTALVEGLALSIVKEERCSRKLHGYTIVFLDLTLLVAGTTLRGQFETRLSDLIREAELLLNNDIAGAEKHLQNY